MSTRRLFAVLAVLAALPAVAAGESLPLDPRIDDPRPWETAELPVPDLPALDAGTLAFSESISLGIPTVSLGLSGGGGPAGVSLWPYEAYGPFPAFLGMEGLSLSGLGLGIAGAAGLGAGGAIGGTSGSTGTRVAFGASLAGSWSRTLERTESAYGFTLGLGIQPSAFRFPASDTAGSSAISAFDLGLTPYVDVEWRRYPVAGQEFFVFLGEMFWDRFEYVRNVTDERNTWANSLVSRTRAGVGWGRVLDVGAATRLQRLVRHLEARGALAGPVPPEVGDEILAHWYALRNEIGTYPHLAWTIRILERHGLLARPLDPEETYAAVSLIEDALRTSLAAGWRADASVDFREDANHSSGLTFLGGTSSEDRHEERMAVSLSGRYARLFGTDRSLNAALVLHVAPAWQENPFDWLAAVGRVEYEHHFFGRHEDALGWLSASLQLGVATAWGDYRPGVDPAPGGGAWTDPLPRTLPVAFSHPAIGTAAFPVWGGEATTRFDVATSWNRALSRASELSAGLALSLEDVPNQDFAWRLSFNVGFQYGVARGSFSRYSAGL